MKGLLLKEWYESIAYGKTVLGAALVMFAVSAILLHENSTPSFFLVYASFLLGIFPMTLLSYDENFGWTTYSYTLPVSKTQLVSVKYLLTLLGALIGFLLSALILSIFGGGLERSSVTLLLAESVIAPLISNAFLLPMNYRFGPTKARYVYLAIIALFAGLLGGFFGDSALGQPLPALSPIVLLGGLAVTLLLLTLSWRISIAWYGKSHL